jgi:hypothetical protein
MPALVAGIHVLRRSTSSGVDGRDKPGHDDCILAAVPARVIVSSRPPSSRLPRASAGRFPRPKPVVSSAPQPRGAIVAAYLGGTAMRILLTIVAISLSLVLLSVNSGHSAGGYKGINKVQATDKGAAEKGKGKGADKAGKSDSSTKGQTKDSLTK